MTVPLKPLSSPTLVSQSTTSITVQMPDVTGTQTGGSAITSYNLQFNGGGTGNIYTTLIGEVPLNLVKTFTKNGLTANTQYKFRYRVNNKYGWGPFSDPVTILAATLPG